jgi:hypothetical protein
VLEGLVDDLFDGVEVVVAQGAAQVGGFGGAQRVEGEFVLHALGDQVAVYEVPGSAHQLVDHLRKRGRTGLGGVTRSAAIVELSSRAWSMSDSRTAARMSSMVLKT